jgi:hypothetical protein
LIIIRKSERRKNRENEGRKREKKVPEERVPPLYARWPLLKELLNLNIVNVIYTIEKNTKLLAW